MLTRVRPTQPPKDVVQDRVMERVASVIEQQCAHDEQLSDIKDFALKETNLNQTRKFLDKEDLSNLKARVESALENLKRAKAALDVAEAEQRDIAYIKGLPSQGSVASLRNVLEQIGSLDLRSEEAKRAAEEKRQAANRELERLCSLARSLTNQVSSVGDRESLRKLQNDLLRHQSLFEGSEEEGLLADALRRCEEREKEMDARERAERDKEKQDAPHMAVMEASKIAGASLASLRDATVKFQGFELLTNKAITLRQQKVAEVEEEISRLCECAKSIPAQVGDIRDRASLQVVQAKLLGQQGRFEGSEEQQIFVAALDQCAGLDKEFEQRELVEREAKARNAAVLAAINSTQTSGTLATLRERVVQIRDLDAVTPEARQAREEKLKGLEREITKLEALAQQFLPKLDSVRDRRAVETVRSDLLRHLSRFEGAAEHQALDKLLERCSRLDEFFRKLGAAQREEVKAPAELEARIATIRALEKNYAPHLTSVQTDAAHSAASALERDGEARRRAASQWLDQMEKEAADGHRLDDVLARLQNAPPFLPEEAKGELVALRGQVQGRIDEDQLLQVEMAFRKISDPSRRLQCLDRLRSLLEELQLR